jgi:hypothetical protein
VSVTGLEHWSATWQLIQQFTDFLEDNDWDKAPADKVQHCIGSTFFC